MDYVILFGDILS